MWDGNTALISAWICLSSSTWAIFSWSSSSISWRNSLRFLSSFSAALTSWSKRCLRRSRLRVFCLNKPKERRRNLTTVSKASRIKNWTYFLVSIVPNFLQCLELGENHTLFAFGSHEGRHLSIDNCRNHFVLKPSTGYMKQLELLNSLKTLLRVAWLMDFNFKNNFNISSEISSEKSLNL